MKEEDKDFGKEEDGKNLKTETKLAEKRDDDLGQTEEEMVRMAVLESQAEATKADLMRHMEDQSHFFEAY